MVRTRSSSSAHSIPTLPRRMSLSSPGTPSTTTTTTRNNNPPITRSNRRYSLRVRNDKSNDNNINNDINNDINNNDDDDILEYRPMQTSQRQNEYDSSYSKERVGLPLAPKKLQSTLLRSHHQTTTTTTTSTRSNKRRRQSMTITSHHPSNTLTNQSTNNAQKSTFLSGINIHAKNIDFLSLPDPPSPTKITNSSKRKRRQSSPILRSTPLKDVTNENGNQTQQQIQQHNIPLHPPKKSRSRVLDQNYSKDSTHSTRDCNSNQKVSQSTHHYYDDTKELKDVGISFDSDYEDDGYGPKSKGRRSMVLPKRSYTDPKITTTTTTDITLKNTNPVNREKYDVSKSTKVKKRRSRKSILLPSEVDDEDSSLILQKCNLATHTNSSISNTYDESFTSNQSKVSLIEENDGQLKKIVRELTKIPYQKRFLSDHCSQIEDLTGYKLLTPIDKIKKEFSVKDDKTFTNSLPIDHKRVKRELILRMGPIVDYMESKKNEEIAHTMTETGCRVKKKKGKMIYFDIKSKVEVSSAEYQTRYLQMINKKRNKSNNIDHPKSKNQRNDDTSSGKTSRQVEEKEIDINIKNDLKKNGLGTPVLNSSNSSTIMDENTKEVILDTTGQEEEIIDVVNYLPAKDEPSSDPEIAMAEKKLWAAIDAAMAIFSAEVLSIHNARKKLKSKNKHHIT